MNRREKGQVLVDYALILVLVAIVAIAILAILGPQIASSFCELFLVLEGSGPYPITVSMDLNDVSLTFDVRYPEDEYGKRSGCYGSYTVVDVSDPSHGHVEHILHTTFTYWPTDPGSGFDDSFTVDWHNSETPEYIHTDIITIIIGEPDLSVSEATITSSSKQPVQELDVVDENIIALMEAAVDQEEFLQEGVDLSIEAVVEALEVLIDFADDNDKPLLSATLSQLKGEVKDGNLDAVEDVITQPGTGLSEAPLEVVVALILKMAPRLVDSCVVVSEATVSSDVIAAAVQAVEGLDENHPGKAKALLLLQGAVATIQARNSAAEEYLVFQSEVFDFVVAGFEYVGEYEIAAQLAADSEACGN